MRCFFETKPQTVDKSVHTVALASVRIFFVNKGKFFEKNIKTMGIELGGKMFVFHLANFIKIYVHKSKRDLHVLDF